MCLLNLAAEMSLCFYPDQLHSSRTTSNTSCSLISSAYSNFPSLQIHSLIQPVFTEHLLRFGHCCRCCGFNGEQNTQGSTHIEHKIILGNKRLGDKIVYILYVYICIYMFTYVYILTKKECYKENIKQNKGVSNIHCLCHSLFDTTHCILM